MLRYFTAGESHGPCLTMIIDGVPAGFPLAVDKINHDLWRRQQGYGRGGRMLIEKDEAQVRSGIRWGETIGAPVALGIENRDWKNWTKKMSIFPEDSDDMLNSSTRRPTRADAPPRLLLLPKTTARAVRHPSHGLYPLDRQRRGGFAGAFVRRNLCPVGGVTGANRRQRRRRKNDRADRGMQKGRQYPRRHLRSGRARFAARLGLAHAVGPQARRALGPSVDEYSSDERRGDRPRL